MLSHGVDLIDACAGSQQQGIRLLEIIDIQAGCWGGKQRRPASRDEDYREVVWSNFVGDSQRDPAGGDARRVGNRVAAADNLEWGHRGWIRCDENPAEANSGQKARDGPTHRNRRLAEADDHDSMEGIEVDEPTADAKSVALPFDGTGDRRLSVDGVQSMTCDFEQFAASTAIVVQNTPVEPTHR
jgi:hypothetical protein